MGQSAPPQWWEVIVGILSIPATIIGVVYSYGLIQKTRLEVQKTRLEILELEKKLRNNKKKSSNNQSVTSNNKASSDQKSKSVLQKIFLDIQASENRITNSLMDLLSPFKTFQKEKSEVNINAQRVLGSVIELIFLLLFLYTDASQSAQTMAVLFPMAEIPPFLTNITIPLLASSAGTAFILGLMIGDLLGLTNLTSWADLRERKKPFLAIILATLIMSVVLSSLIALGRMSMLPDSSQEFQSLLFRLATLAQSLIILPVLVTTFLLFNGMQGLFVILALPLVLLRLPLTLSRKFIAKIIYYVSD